MSVMSINKTCVRDSSCPSCQVCSGEASGFHYGVDSCEGCKGFFRRCITQGMTNRCANDEKCEITPFSRNSCQFCRLKKCFAVGMSREGSRLGRRPKRLKGSHLTETKACHKPSENNVEHNSFVRDRNPANKSTLSISSENQLSNHVEYFPNLPLDARREEYYRTADYNPPPYARDRHGLSGTVHHMLHSSVAAAAAVSSGMRKMKQDVVGLSNDMQFCAERETFAPSLRLPVHCVGSVDDLTIVQNSSESSMGKVSSLRESEAKKDWPVYDHILTNASASAKFMRGVNEIDGLDAENVALVANRAGFIKSEGTLDGKYVTYNDISSLPSLEAEFDDRLSLDFGRVQEPHDSVCLQNGNKTTFVNYGTERFQYNFPLKAEAMEPCKHENLQLKSEEEEAEDAVENMKITSEREAWGLSRSSNVRDSFGMKDTGDRPIHVYGEREMNHFSSPWASSSPSFVCVETLIKEVVKPPDDAKMCLIRLVTEKVIESHLNTCNYTSVKVAEGVIRYREMKHKTEALNMNQEVDLSQVWTHFVDNMAPVIQRVVKFSKKIPGFCELHQDDQISLIKQGSFEVILTRYTNLFTLEGMFVPNMTLLVPRDVVQRMPMGEFFEEQFRFAENFNRLKLSDSEIGLLTSIMILCPDREGLTNVTAVRQLYMLLLQSLYIYMKESHSSGDRGYWLTSETCEDLFSRTISILPNIRHINQMHSKQLNNIRMSSPGMVFPPLHQEVFDKTDKAAD